MPGYGRQRKMSPPAPDQPDFPSPEGDDPMQHFLQFISDYGWFIGIPLGFIVIVVYVFRPGARKKYEEEGRIPLEDKNPKHD
jgi:cbb3-type cytochrome oxidase subunit 3